MAEEETKKEQTESKRDTEGDSEEVTPKKKPPKKVILIAAGVLVLAILGAVGYLVFAPSSQASPGEEDGEAVTAEGEQQEEGDTRSSRRSSQSSRRGGSEETVSTDIYMTDFPSAVVNLGASEKYDYVYLKYGFNLELADEKVRAEIGRKMPKLVSLIDAAMSGHSWDKIGNARGRESLAKDVVNAINAQLETGEVVACHFVTFVAQ